MHLIRSISIFFSLLVPAILQAGTAPVSLMPAVSEVAWSEASPLGNDGVITLSPDAGPPEHRAAELFQLNVKRRFGVEWKISTDPSATASVQVLLGLPKGFPALEQACAAHSISVPQQADGYALYAGKDGGGVRAVVAGNNARGVFYGQDTLFQLLSRKGDALTLQGAKIRDWPTIPMRGRPHPHYEYFLKPEHFDITMMSRINYIDVRDGIYAFEPGARIKRDEIRKVITQARERDLIVFAVVNCGVPADQYDAVIGSFKEFLDLGANALWLSFDDKGPGAAPTEITKRVLALGRERGIRGNCIAITPPKGSYQTVATKFNTQIMAVAGMEDALWYWTSIPCAQDVADARSIAMKTLPSWWHNWPRYREGSMSVSQRYSPVIGLEEGWNHPSAEELRAAGKYVQAVLPWDGTQAQQEYVVGVIGWWSWRPELHDFSAVRSRIYDVVFGPDNVEAARQFDDAFNEAYKRLRFTLTHTDYTPQCPPRLRNIADRPLVLSKLQVMEKQLQRLRDAKGSIADPERLQRQYLGPMAGEVASGLAEVEAPYPEYWFAEHQAKVLNAIYDHQPERAAELIASAKPRVLEEISKVEELLGPHGLSRGYADWWRQRAAMTPDGWSKLIDARKVELKDRVADYGKTVAPFEAMVKNLKDPPLQFGTGAWERHNHVLATLLPEDREVFWGDWIGGIVEKNQQKVAVFSLDRHTMVEEGTFAEMPLTLPISGKRDRLALVFYLADINKESFGLGYAKWRWSGYRSMRLIWKEQDIWRTDLGIPRPNGEWFIIPLPTLPDDLKTLTLRIRVEDYASAKNNFEIVYVGPVHLLEIDRD